jgi:hypothetical protein
MKGEIKMENINSTFLVLKIREDKDNGKILFRLNVVKNPQLLHSCNSCREEHVGGTHPGKIIIDPRNLLLTSI